MRKNVDAGDVIREFYRQRQERTGQRPPSFRRPGVVQAAERFLERFKALEADDPFGYMRWRWDAAQHAGHPVGLVHLASDPLILRWRERGHGFALEAAKAEKLMRRAGTAHEQAVKELRILTPGMEAAKRPYEGRRALCVADIELTGGFHPRSPACAACTAAVACAARLYQIHGWDVVSLRAGRLHLLPREVAAAAVR